MTRPSKPLFLSKLPDKCSVSYRNLFEPSDRRAAIVRETCAVLWEDFHDLADKNFTEHLPLDFHRRWFEMYLGAALRRAGLDVSAPKPGPDFRIMLNGRPIYIQAIAPMPGHALHPDAVPQPIYSDADGSPVTAMGLVTHTQITLRFAHAFRMKADVFDGYRKKGYVGEGDPCISPLTSGISRTLGSTPKRSGPVRSTVLEIGSS